jgi:hypothetical protein
MKTTIAITAAESRRRADAYERIRHSTEMEGGAVPGEAEQIIQEFVTGVIDEPEMMRRIAARFNGQR